MLDDKLDFDIEKKTVRASISILGLNKPEDLEKGKFTNVGLGGLTDFYTEEQYTQIVTDLTTSGEILESDSFFTKLSKAAIYGVKLKLAQDPTYSLNLEDMEVVDYNF